MNNVTNAGIHVDYQKEKQTDTNDVCTLSRNRTQLITKDEPHRPSIENKATNYEEIGQVHICPMFIKFEK